MSSEHTHGAHGTFRTEHTTFVNAALVGEFFDLDMLPIVLDSQAGLRTSERIAIHDSAALQSLRHLCFGGHRLW
jgi:hypothetical protein